MSNVPQAERLSVEEVSEVFERNKKSIRATSRELGISRSSVRRKLHGTNLLTKPLYGGTVLGTETLVKPLPPEGEVYRYILTSAQNNTEIHKEVWANIKALAKFYKAQIMVGTYTYNQNKFGKLAVKRNKKNPYQHTLWYAREVRPFFADTRVQLANGLVFCGEMNTLPTAVNPLANFETYSGRKSAIFPHAKMVMRSVPTMQSEGVKLNYTTGTVTQKNYIAKREGLKAEFHHIYGAVLAEVDSNGNWWVRQLNYDQGTDSIQDLNVLAVGGKIVSTTASAEAITYGDLHGTHADPDAVRLAQDELDTMRPKYQFIHDSLEGASINPHQRHYKTNHEKFHTWLRGYHKLENELVDTARLLETFDRPFAQTVIVDSNHDDWWLKRWLREHDYRVDPPNTEVFLKLQAWYYDQIRNGVTEEQSRARTAKPKMPRDINVLEYAFREVAKYKAPAKFLVADESFLTANGKIENGMHGHLGPNGRRGTPENLSKIARRANTAHTHSAGIFEGLYVAGTNAYKRWDYTKGPNSQTQSDIITYPNGKRQIITKYAGKWRA